MSSEGADELDAFAGIGAQVGAAGDKIALVKVIGTYAHHEEAVDEGLKDNGIVIYALEEDGLIAEGNAGISKAFTGLPKVKGTLGRMVDMDTHPNGAVLFKHIA